LRKVTDPQTLRADMLLDPAVTFLNHGSYGATPRPVFEAYQRWQRELERQPVEFLGRRSDGLLDAARAVVAGYLGFDWRDLLFVPTPTTGINVVARSLGLRPGDEVLTTDLEYGACDRAWEHACHRAGATYVRQPVPLPVREPADVVEAIWAGVTPRTRVVYLSHITSGTALRLPVEAICARARAAGILTVIDGAHAPGQIPLDLAAIGADAYAGNLHKWLSAPKGSGFLHVRREHHGWIEAPIVSWGWVEGSASRRQPEDASEFVNRNQWQGTRDLAAFLATPDAIAYQAAHDWPSVRERCHRLAAEALDRAVERFGKQPLSCRPASADHRWFEQMVCLPLPTADGRELKARLYDEFRIEAPVTVHAGRVFLRLSFQGYNDRADLERVFAALDALVPARAAA
jgi:isopenicillin-N epimerase